MTPVANLKGKDTWDVPHSSFITGFVTFTLLVFDFSVIGGGTNVWREVSHCTVLVAACVTVGELLRQRFAYGRRNYVWGGAAFAAVGLAALVRALGYF